MLLHYAFAAFVCHFLADMKKFETSFPDQMLQNFS